MFGKRKDKITSTLPKTPPKSPLKVKELLNPTVNIFGMTFFLSLGAVFILNIVGLIPITIWDILWRFWPAYILMFVMQFFTKKSRFIRFMLTGLGIGILLSIAFFFLAKANPKAGSLFAHLSPTLVEIRKFLGIELGQKVSDEISIKEKEFENPKTRNVSISTTTGYLNVTDNVTTDFLKVKSIHYEYFGKPNINTKLENSKLVIDLTTTSNRNALFGGIQDVSYDVSIGKVVLPTEVDINLLLGTVNVSFNSLKLEKLNYQMVGGTTNIYLGKPALPTGETNLRVGAGNLTLKLPYDTFAEIKYDAGVGKLWVDNQELTGHGVYTTPKFSVTESPIRINVNLGVGTIKIITLEQ